MKKRITFFLIAAIVTLSACSLHPDSSDKETKELRQMLTDIGYEVTIEPTNNSEFGGSKYLFEVDQTPLYVYVYDTTEDAQTDADRISEDGYTYTTSKKTEKMDWTGTPHYYLYENHVILYLGNSSGTEDTLQQLFGPPFSGA